MDDLELQRILAETMQESTFGNDTEQLGGDLPDEVEVTVEDLVYTLRQIATAVIEVRELVEQQEQKLDALQDLVAEHHQSQHTHADELATELRQSLAQSQAAAQKTMLDQVKAMGSVLAEIATSNPNSVRSFEQPANREIAPQDSTQDGKSSVQDTAKRRSDDRKLTFTARLQRKMLYEAAAKSDAKSQDDSDDGGNTADKPTPKPAQNAQPKAKPTAPAPSEKKTPAIRRPEEAPRVPPARSDAGEPEQSQGSSAPKVKSAKPSTDKVTITTDKVTAEPKPKEEPAAEPAIDHPPIADTGEIDDGSPRNSGDVPVPESIKQIQKQVFSFKLAVSQIVRSNKLPRLGTPLANDIANLLTEKSNEILKKSLDLHNRNLPKAQEIYASKAKAGAQDPAIFWPDDLVQQYRDFRTDWFVKNVLDKVEVSIRKSGLDDHLLLLDELAMELELGRIAVQEGTVFDGKRHQVKEGTQKPLGGDFYTIVVNQLFKPGYVDLSTGKTIRKAVVSVKMVPR